MKVTLTPESAAERAWIARAEADGLDYKAVFAWALNAALSMASGKGGADLRLTPAHAFCARVKNLRR